MAAPLREQFKKKLSQRLAAPRVQADALRELPDCYKIKLRASGYRLIYQVRELEVVVLVVAIGKRERGAAYRTARERT